MFPLHGNSLQGKCSYAMTRLVTSLL
jgi:hypothetical protein